jgi:hypothetical protein
MTEIKFTETGTRARIIAKEEGGHEIRMVDFDNWWDNKVVICDKFKKTFTRRKLILELADTDGGAHVDSSIKENYWKQTRENSINWFVHDKTGRPIPIENPVPLCIRQIAHEVIQTFKSLNLYEASTLHK